MEGMLCLLCVCVKMIACICACVAPCHFMKRGVRPVCTRSCVQSCVCLCECACFFLSCDADSTEKFNTTTHPLQMYYMSKQCEQGDRMIRMMEDRGLVPDVQAQNSRLISYLYNKTIVECEELYNQLMEGGVCLCCAACCTLVIPTRANVRHAVLQPQMVSSQAYYNLMLYYIRRGRVQHAKKVCL